MSFSALGLGHKAIFVAALAISIFSALWFTKKLFAYFGKSESNIQKSGFIFIISLLFLNLGLFLVLEVSSPTHMITLFVPLIILIVFFIASVSKVWQSIVLFIFGAASILSLSDYYRSTCSTSESVNYTEVAQYLVDNTGGNDIIILEDMRNSFYTLLYYCHDISSPMRYTNVGKYPTDEFQIDRKYFDALIVRNPVLVLNALTKDYDRVHWLSSKGMEEMTKDSTHFHIESSTNFGHELSAYIFCKTNP